MRTFAAVIDAFGGCGGFAAAIGIPDSHARTMKARNSIPVAYWPDVVAKADQLGLRGVTYEALAKCTGPRRRRASGRVAA